MGRYPTPSIGRLTPPRRPTTQNTGRQPPVAPNLPMTRHFGTALGVIRRRWRLVLAVVLVVAIRVVLPVVVRHQLVAQASQALHARVDLRDVDLALWKGGITLKD